MATDDKDDIAWADVPDPKVTGRWVPIWRAPVGEAKLIVWPLSEEVVGCYLRWNGEFSQVCRPSEVELQDGKPKSSHISWRGHLWAWDDDRVGIVQFGTEALKTEGRLQCPDLRSKPLRGQRLMLWRSPQTSRGKVLARLDDVLPPHVLPHVGDLRTALRYIYRTGQRLGSDRSVRVLPMYLEPDQKEGTNG